MDRSERIGLGVSAAGHALLIAVLALGLLHWSAPRELLPPTMDVALTDNIALESRAVSHEPPQVAQAPELGPIEPEAPPDQPTVVPEPKPEPKAIAKPEPAKAEPKPQPSPKTVKAEPARTPPAKPEPEKTKTQRASRFGESTLKGLDSEVKSDSRSETASGNAPLSAEAARALRAEITRQLKPYWRAPTGVDADKLVTTLTWRLNADGSLASGPTLVEQTGKTASNAPQQQLHIEAAIRAVRAAAPFRLPPDLYDSWKYIKEFGFDKRL